MSDSKPLSYRVILKNGTHSIFTNNNHFDNFKDVLVSGIYMIDEYSIDIESVQSITEVEAVTCPVCNVDFETHPGSNACPRCGEDIMVPSPEH